MASLTHVSGRSRSSMVLTSSVVSGGGDDSTSVKRISHYQVYRGMSPTTSNRLEIRLKELEETLESEREARIRAETELSEAGYQIDDLAARLEEAEGVGSAQSEVSRRREQEIQKLKKDLELITSQYDSWDATLKKKHQEALKELEDQLDRQKHDKTKFEKERQQLNIEIDSLSSMLDACNKAKASAESKVDGMDSQLRRLQGHLEELGRQNQELNGLKARLIQENHELNRHVQDLDTGNGVLSKAKITLQQQLDEAKTNLDEESTVRSQLTNQLTNLQVDYDNLASQLEEEMDAAVDLRNQLLRSQNEYQSLKSKYDKEIIIVTEEMEESRRKLIARIAELEDAVNQAQSRASKLEKERTSLQIEIRDVVEECNKMKSSVTEMGKRLKQGDHMNLELHGRLEELTSELQSTAAEKQTLLAEVPRLKTLAEEGQKKLDVALRDNKQLSEMLRELQSQNKELSRKTNDLQVLRVQLETERNGLANELAEAQDALKEAQAQLETKHNTLGQIRTELERRLHEKDDEMETIRRNSQKAIEELQRSTSEIESKYRSEISRLKKKYEVDVSEYDHQLDNLSRSNAELAKANKALATRIKDLELALEAERRSGEDAKQAVVLVERKRAHTQKELEDVRARVDSAERARKSTEAELSEATIRIGELTSSVTSLSTERRRVEADVSRILADLDEANRGRREAEERADRLQAEVNRLTDGLRQEQDQARRAEEQRQRIEVEMREVVGRLQEAETFAQREGKRILAKLQARLHEVEAELDAEQRRGRDVVAENRKLLRLLQDQKTQVEDANRTIKELCDKVNALQAKLKTTTRQLSEAEEVVAITMNRYRKANQMLNEYERQSESVQGVSRSLQVVGPGSVTGIPGSRRSMSVTREITRVVRI